jgi:CBS-domain-containing membrane protein
MALRVVANRLSELTAEDLMSREVLTLSRELSIQDAVRALSRARVGGAPVVDERGRCIGVFSVSDCNRRVRSDNRAARTPPPVPGCVCSEWEMVEQDWNTFPADAVSRYMTPDPVMVQPATPVSDLAQMMVDVHIHRLIVAGEDRRPIGIVSSTDVLAAVARAAREQEHEESDHDSSTR